MLTTAEYGQPGGLRKRRGQFRATFDAKAYSYIALPQALTMCTAPVNTAWIRNWTTGEVLDALEVTP